MILVNFLDTLYSKLPKFSPELKQFLIKVLPWIALIFGLLIAFASVMDIIGTPFLNVLGGGEGIGVFQKLMIVNVLGVFQGVFMLFAFKPLRRKQNKGWRLLLWSQILWVIAALITLSPSFILGFIFLYPLFQVRESYR